jgi:hypothetical protein
MPASSAMVVVAGNISGEAWKFLEQHGARIEEAAHGLYFIELPEAANMSEEHTCDACGHPRRYGISFEGESDSESIGIAAIVEISLLAYETRIYTLFR